MLIDVPISGVDRALWILFKKLFYSLTSKLNIFFVPRRIEATERALQIFPVKRLVDALKKAPDDGKRKGAVQIEPRESCRRENKRESEDLKVVPRHQATGVADHSW